MNQFGLVIMKCKIERGKRGKKKNLGLGLLVWGRVGRGANLLPRSARLSSSVKVSISFDIFEIWG
jgi:hypothetical protein